MFKEKKTTTTTSHHHHTTTTPQRTSHRSLHTAPTAHWATCLSKAAHTRTAGTTTSTARPPLRKSDAPSLPQRKLEHEVPRSPMATACRSARSFSLVLCGGSAARLHSGCRVVQQRLGSLPRVIFSSGVVVSCFVSDWLYEGL